MVHKTVASFSRRHMSDGLVDVDRRLSMSRQINIDLIKGLCSNLGQ